MLQSVYLFKEKVLIVLGLFVQPGIVLHTHCTVQDSQDSVFQSLCHLMMLLTQGFSHGCICLYLTVSANAWLFQPVHRLRRLRPWGVAENWVICSANNWRESSIRCVAFSWLKPWGVAENWVIHSANSWRENSIRCVAFSPLRPWGVAQNWVIRSANSWRESSISGVNKVIIN